MRKALLTIVCVALAAGVAGCGSSPVADDVPQREANEIVSKLEEGGISASVSKARGGKGRYSVLVPSGRFSEAVGLLNRLGLPAERKASFQELTASNGILPTSREVEALRLDRATAAEIEDLLKARPEFDSVSALVRARSLGGRGAPSATVVAQKRAGQSVSVEELRGTIASIITRAVPGIKPEDVLVSVTESRLSSSGGTTVKDGQGSSEAERMTPFLIFWKVPVAEYSGLVMLLMGLVLFAALLAGFAGYLLGQFNWINKQSLGGARSQQLPTPRAREFNEGGEE
jgi:type III secretory pathway lipoprotein EscJ